ncbi:MAG: hypothetical protein AMJ90_05865 [candidate division Zixibacteria bacterium SM23_73_2]|nr:MAG: hypothetical protein AMJ90_05865 [candidate division Zixibacteria bacterium SM23_73_2]
MKRIFYLFLIIILLSDFSFAGVSVIGGLTREKVLLPGDKFEGKITLENTGETSWQVDIYKSDYLFYADGTNIYGEPSSSDRSNASWLTLSPSRLTIHPKEKASVFYTVQVPKNLDLFGTYWSMVMIEPASEVASENLEDKEGRVKVGVQTKVRYGIQIVTNIGDTGAKRIKFLDKKLINQDGNTFFQIDVQNIGEMWLSPTLWVELYNQNGMIIGRFEGDKKRIYPTCSVRHKIDLTDIPKGKYKALVVVDNGDEHVFGAKYDLGIE